MTREEAKTFLCSIAGDLGFTDIENYTCKDGEKMREAIKALEQEPCGDAVSRQAALGCCRNEWEEEVEIRLKSLPPVTPAEKVGHFIDADGGVECSGCGHWYPHASIAKRVLKYCNECGMKLEVQDADND